MRRPGIEPGSTAWKAAMLTIIPPTLTWYITKYFNACCRGHTHKTISYSLHTAVTQLTLTHTQPGSSTHTKYKHTSWPGDIAQW